MLLLLLAAVVVVAVAIAAVVVVVLLLLVLHCMHGLRRKFPAVYACEPAFSQVLGGSGMRFP